MDDLLKVGIITSTHGLKGEVKVFPTTDDVNRFSELKTVKLDTGREMMELKLSHVKFFKKMAILKFKGINHINDVEQYKGKELYITRDQAAACGEDEYFIGDLMGIKVVSDEQEELGELTDVLITGANDVYVVSREGSADLLLPAIKECILNIDMKQRLMQVHIMPGLR